MPDALTPAADRTLYPRVCQGLAEVPVRDGVVIDGPPTRQLFSGKHAPLVRRLLPLLDGTKTVETLADLLEEPLPRMRNLIDLLDGCGVIEYFTDPRQAGDEYGTEAEVYYSRTIGANAGGHLSARHITAKLTATRVQVIAPPGPLSALTDDLSALGLGSVVGLGVDDEPFTPGTFDLVVVFDDPPASPNVRAAFDHYRRAGTPVLRVGTAATAVEIGPLFLPGLAPCHPCFQRNHQAVLPTSDPGTTPDPYVVDAAVALAGAEVSALLAGTTVPVSLKTLVRTSLPDFGDESFLALPEPGCEECEARRSWALRSPEVNAFEWMIELPPHPLAADKRQSHIERKSLAELELRRDPHATSPRVALPPAADVRPPGVLPDSPGGGAAANPTTMPDDAALAGLLMLTAGLRDAGTAVSSAELRDRWAPSGGNLASVQLYLLCHAPACSLPGCVHKYQDLTHELVSVRADEIPLAEALRGTDLDPGRLDLAVAFVGDVGRIREKYGNYSYRLAHLDAGCAAMQFGVAALTYGFDVRFATRWDGRLAKILELDENAEIVTALAGLTRRKAGTRADSDA